MLNYTIIWILVLLCLWHIKQSNSYNDDIFELGSSYRIDKKTGELRLWLTISAERRFVEVSWKNAPAKKDDLIVITNKPVDSFKIKNLQTESSLNPSDSTSFKENEYYGSTTTEIDSTYFGVDHIEGSGFSESTNAHWISNNDLNDIVAAIRPTEPAQWFTTGVFFDFDLSRNVTLNTSCYGFWASYINGNGTILTQNCIRAYPHWMNEMRSIVGGLRIRDIFIPGTHDSGSFRPNFDPLIRETIVTKYALTQDDDIRGQLMHGVRYLDIRVGYYRGTDEKFFINHGITKQRPLLEVIQQVKDFVFETNEIVIFGLKEFPVGFGRSLGVHRLLAHYLQEHFGDIIVHPSLSWRASLQDLWSRGQNIIVAYDKPAVVQEFPYLLFGSVEQRWGNVQDWARLKRHLQQINSIDVSRFSNRPVADMAELTPAGAWDVISDKYGGLRRMADKVNWRISQLYREELGRYANIVAVDFIRGTTIVENAIDWNKRKITN